MFTLKGKLYLVWCFGDKWIHTKMHLYIHTVFGLTHPEEEVWPGGTQPMLLSEPCYVCIPSFRSVAPRVCLAKVAFLAFLAYMNRKR